MKKSVKGVGLAIIGGGRVGLFRGEVAARHPAVEWIGLAEKNPNRAGEVGPKINADFVTQSHVELLKRPEVTAAIICTDEHLHVDPIMAAVERGIPVFLRDPRCLPTLDRLLDLLMPPQPETTESAERTRENDSNRGFHSCLLGF